MATQQLRKAFRFFLDNAGYCTPPGRAACALALAKAEQAAIEEGLTFEWEDCQEEWDGDCPAPDMLLNCTCRDEDIAFLVPAGAIEQHIGLNHVYRHEMTLFRGQLLQPYQRVVQAELAMEALHAIADRETTSVRQL